MIYKVICLIFSFLICLSSEAIASDIKLCGIKEQGRIITGYAPDIETLKINGNNISLSPSGEFIFAFTYDDKLTNEIETTDFEGNSKKYNLKISKAKWDIQDIKGIEQKKVTPSKEDQKEIEKERTDVRKAQSINSENLFWRNDFILPVEGRISGKFGGVRIMNGKKMNPHMGMDIAAKEGVPVKAAADGIVKLSGENNYFYSGNVIVIDHGFGLHTIYAHLLETKIKAGEKIKKGDIIGTVGKTGRATGAHLHWGASLNGTRFDPMSLLDKNKFCLDL